MSELDNSTPGGVYLCQTDQNISCGACCGLYNISDLSYEKLFERLSYRTELYKKTPRDYDSLEKFQEIIRKKEKNSFPYPEFHHCHYIGLIGENEDKPGCLLHPYGKGNNNVDHRGLSHWGGFACSSYFCPTCSKLPSRYKKILRISAVDWYIYGLVVTETEMLSTLFSQIEQSAGKELSPELFANNDPLRQSLSKIFALKIDWEYRPDKFDRIGNYFFKDDLYPLKKIDYTRLGLEASVYDTIFLALGSEFRTADDVKTAEKRIEDLIGNTVSLL